MRGAVQQMNVLAVKNATKVDGADDALSRTAFDELYGTLRDAPANPVTVAHLGQSLDGFIATRSGDSRFVTGPANLVHLHRMRSLCDAVVVGAGTVAIDDPQLTTRLVPGQSPLRVVIDPQRTLGAHYRVFSDGAAPTLVACGVSRLGRWALGPVVQGGPARHGRAELLGVPEAGTGLDLAALLAALRLRGFMRVFIEGGGQTVSSFLAAGLVDRLQIAVAPFLIGDGRPAIRLPPPAQLGDCKRPARRVYRMGDDILFDFDLARARPPHLVADPEAGVAAGRQAEPVVVRVL
jgi:diaminohydroxyphosphoribosylaminopyrimidine deaminase/5-amino-6-(5-phosphoribosylamino)uracil reductase